MEKLRVVKFKVNTVMYYSAPKYNDRTHYMLCDKCIKQL